MDKNGFFSLIGDKFALDDIKKNRLIKYLELVIDVNKVMDITANETEEEILEKNFYDSIMSSLDLDFNNKTLIDVGSGGGFPGMLYAIMNPTSQVTLLEPMNKRCNFLNRVKDELELDNVEIVCARAEDYIKNKREVFDFASARGVSKLNILLELVIPFLKVNGIFIALKSKMAFEEENNAKNALELLKVKRVNIQEFKLPTNKETRINLYYQKEKSSDKKYPRNYSQIKKRPL